MLVLLVYGVLYHITVALIMPPVSKPLAPEDSDLLKKRHSPDPKRIVKVRTYGLLQNEVEDIPTGDTGKSIADDYIDFSNEPLRNGGANRNLKPVTYKPILKKYEIPSTEPEADTTDVRTPQRESLTPSHSQQYVVQQPQLRKGYYYQHYPYYHLPLQYMLRPQYGYIYPPQYQNVAYTYYHPLRYRDYYNIYRGDPRFNPNTAVGCGGAWSCRSGCVGGYGCRGGCNNGNACDGYETENEDESFEEESTREEEDQEEPTEEKRINKQDPLEDLDLEELEKLEKTSVEDTKDSGRSKRILAQ